MSSCADFEGGLVMALVPKGVSNSTAATTEHFRSSSAFYSLIHPFHKYPLSKHYGPATAPGTGNSVVNEPRRISAVKQFIFLLGKMTKYRSKLVGKESGKCCRGNKAGLGSHVVLGAKNLPANIREVGDTGLIPG